MIRLINNLKNKKGFTLIELIVVLAVLAVIMAIAIPRFAGVRTSATIDSDLSTVTSIAKLAELELAKENITTGSSSGGAASIGSKSIHDLIDENFDEDNLFQTNDLGAVTLSDTNVKVEYNAEGTVTNVIIGSYDFEKGSDGKFDAPASLDD